MNLNFLKETLEKILIEYNLEVYSIRTKREHGLNIVEILIDSMDLDILTLEEIHKRYVEVLPEDAIFDNYYLELSTVGAERPIETLEDLENAINKYVYFEKDGNKIYGTLIDVDNDIIKVETFIKGRRKVLQENFNEVRKMRNAVKL